MKQALVFKECGIPRNVLRVTGQPVRAVGVGEIMFRTLAFPVNPSDVNQIQGVYPSMPERTEWGSIAGNEGLFEVTRVGDGCVDVPFVDGKKGANKGNRTQLQVGDFVIPSVSCFGTWRQGGIAKASDFIKVPSDPKNILFSATVSVNTCTAYRLLEDHCKKGDTIIQNGATSHVGMRVIEIAREMGIKTVNVIRDGGNKRDAIVNKLKRLGADHVLIDSELESDESKRVLDSIGKPSVALNCVGGKSSSELVKWLGKGGEIVTYGGMSGKGVMLSTSALIFKNIKATGFWMTEWYKEHVWGERVDMLDTLYDMRGKGLLSDLDVESVAWNRCDKESDTRVLDKIRETMDGRSKEKVIVRVT